MPFVFRAWIDDDAGCDREISRTIYPEYQEEPGHPAWFPAQQLGARQEYSSRYVVVESQTRQPIAYATLWELRPRRYRFDLAVRPEWQGQGIGTRLFSRVMRDSVQFGATGLQARVRDDKMQTLELLGRHGFKESHRMGAYRLDFTEKNERDCQDALLHLRQQGIEVIDLPALRKQDCRYLEQFHELYCAARQDWPDPDPDPTGSSTFSPATIQRWLDEAKSPETFFVAKRAQRYVAFTSFFAIGTAVHPEYRRRGIATLLKMISIADAYRRGFRGQTTSSASPGMQALLKKLGYQRTWSEVRLIREMK